MKMRRIPYWLTGLALLGAVVASSAQSQSAAQTYITIERGHLEEFQRWYAAQRARPNATVSALPAVKTFPTLAAQDGIVATRVPEALLPMLGEFMHEKRNVCGGYFAHQTATEATQFIVDGQAAALNAANLQVNHTVDNQAFVQPLLGQVQESRIRSMISSLEGFTNRWYNASFGRQSSTFIRDQWQALIPSTRTDVTVSLVSCSTCGQQPNVVLTIPGTDLASEIVVLGAHADSIISGQTASSRAPGADDDASGIAVLTEVIRLAMQANYRPRRSVHIMGYAAEEVGLRGSNSIATSYRNAGRNVVGVLQLDMTNFRNSATTRDIWLLTDNSNASLLAFMRELFSVYMAGSGFTLGETSCGYACSDHASWTRNGYPAGMFFENRFGQHNTAIHTTRDTLATSGGTANHSVHFARLALAFMGEAAKGSGGGTTSPTATPLQSGVPVTNITLATNQQRFYRLDVPAGRTSVRFVTSGGTGDTDLYVRFGSLPTTTTSTCRSTGSTNSETCTINAPAAGTYFVLLHGFSAASGVSLTGTF